MTNERDRRRSRIGNATVVAILVGAALTAFLLDGAIRWPDAGRHQWFAAFVVLVVYAILCVVFIGRTRIGALPVNSDVLVAYATQTGLAEELARRTASALVAAGHRVTVTPLARVDETVLARTALAFLVVATYGDGEAPDTERRFARHVLARSIDASGLSYGLLALGDRKYEHFCGFGRTVDRWLKAQGADALFPMIEVDDGSMAAIAVWAETIATLAGTPVEVEAAAIPFSPWRLVARTEANPGSVGAPAFHVVLEPVGDERPSWEAGDIAVVRLPDGVQREYSIASLADGGRIELLVRRSVRADSLPGRGAQWLTEDLALGATTDVHVRANHGFRLEGVAAATPLILVGNGTGIAGLRAHIKARAARGATHDRLYFGERNAASDAFYRDEIATWCRDGVLDRARLAYSRDGERRTYVQDLLLEDRADIADRIAAGAIVLVCGSATGMASGVDAALRAIVGDAVLDDLAAQGRYRRDVY